MQGCGATLVFQCYPGHAPGQCLLHEPIQLVGRLRVTEPLRTDVRDAIAFRVGPAGLGRVGELGTETVVRTHAGTFTNQHENQLRPQCRADGIAQSDTRLLREHHRNVGPTRRRQGDEFIQ